MLRLRLSLTVEQRRLLEVQAARTGRSISALVGEAVRRVYGPGGNAEADLRALDIAFGAWTDRGVDGEGYVERLRSGGNLNTAPY